MSIGSVDFMLFFTLAVLCYHLVPAKFKCLWLLGCSLYYYRSFTTRHIPILLGVTAGAYLLAHLLAKLQNKTARRLVLAAGAAGGIGLLIWIKYAAMFGLPAFPISGQPLGISFFSLVAVGYLADQYKRKYPPEKNIIRFAVFVSFFPLISSGPIERGDGLLPQLAKPAPFDWQQLRLGLTRMLWGYFLKFVVADTLAISVGKVYGNVTGYTGPFLCLAALMFAYQLYCDFAGYSDIAIGACQVMGLKVRENFARPFAAANFSDLWDRWHISLSTWFRDYVYFPLGGSRKGAARAYLNVMIVFLVSGLWHGTSWSFVVWGAANGIFVVLSKVYTRAGRPLEKYNPLHRHPVTKSLWQSACCLVIFAFCFVLFRANSFADALYIYTHMATGWVGALLDVGGTIGLLKSMNIGRVTIALLGVGIGLSEGVSCLSAKRGELPAAFILRQKAPVRIALWYIQLLLIAFYGALGASSFIYFQF